MSLIHRLSIRLQNHPKRVVFPEGGDPRILQAARQFATRRLGIPILLGDRTQIKENASLLNIRLDGIRVIEPSRSEELDGFCQKFQGLRRFRGMADREALEYVTNNNYFATLMLATGGADAVVSGATLAASSALRPLFQIIPLQDDVKTASSMLILELEESKLGMDGVLFLADCGVIPEPDETQLCDIAVTTASLAHHLTNVRPRVAMLSYSTKASSTKRTSVSKVQAATSLAREKSRRLNLDVDIDGELQADAALDPATAKVKHIEGSVAGRANVLVFPDLNSGNIASKLIQITSGARSYGQILTGLSKPAAEISRGASAHDIFGTTVLVAAQAVDLHLLYPMEKTGV